MHFTGDYPERWEGHRFNKPIEGWVAGDDSKTVKEILQRELLGPPGAIGTGLIPGDAIIKTTARTGLADAIDSVWVRHKSGGISTFSFKSYEQGRKSFQGTAKDWIWNDEECPLDIYEECLIRTMTTNGRVILTFTPLSGLTKVVLKFLPGGKTAQEQKERFAVMAGWDDVPHLTPEAKAELEKAIQPYMLEARKRGVPHLGSGAIYPIDQNTITVQPFEIPSHWVRAYGLDVGWKRTAAVWGALDRDTDTLYLYSEHYQGHAESASHAMAIKSRGEWIPGVIDPASEASSQTDGEKLIEQYREHGLNLDKASNTVYAGIDAVWTRMIAGRLKIFASLANLLDELRLYRRDEKGHIVKDTDHLMDAMRYLVMSGLERAITKPVLKPVVPIRYQPQRTRTGGNTGWMR